jgi:hypothetical protein
MGTDEIEMVIRRNNGFSSEKTEVLFTTKDARMVKEAIPSANSHTLAAVLAILIPPVCCPAGVVPCTMDR